MKRIIATFSVMVLVFALSISLASAKANFSGTWVMDASKSEGIPNSVQQEMTVVQTDDTIKLETKVKTDEGDFAIADSYVVNGKEVDFVPQTPQGPNGKGKRTAKWTADGNGIEVTEQATFDTPDGQLNQQMTRKWTLSADGKSLVIELSAKGPDGTTNTKRLFTKKS
ncbi:MAG TPA: hypothetical protein VKA70_18300 [Blastocatellia bacterium]|nr:hypothetical protein [Blastocatellia bacterium]